MHANYTKQTNIWKCLTPLDSTHLEVFLRFLWDFSFFWIQIQILNLDRLGTGRNQNRSGPIPMISGPIPIGSVNPCGQWGSSTGIKLVIDKDAHEPPGTL
jgi:hypothetical protein